MAHTCINFHVLNYLSSFSSFLIIRADRQAHSTTRQRQHGETRSRWVIPAGIKHRAPVFSTAFLSALRLWRIRVSVCACKCVHVACLHSKHVLLHSLMLLVITDFLSVHGWNKSLSSFTSLRHLCQMTLCPQLQSVILTASHLPPIVTSQSQRHDSDSFFNVSLPLSALSLQLYHQLFSQ